MFYIKLDKIGINITVKHPAMPIDKLPIAPSTSPSSNALLVPTAWAAVPSAIPLDIECLIPPIYSIASPIIYPKIPVRIIQTTVIDSIPPKIFVSDIPIGVVIDLGNIEYSICESAFATLQISTTHINDIKTPVSIPTNISFIYFLNRWNCLYRGTAKTTVTGPNIKFIVSAPILKLS